MATDDDEAFGAGRALRRCTILYDNRHPAQIVLCAESFRDRWGKGPALSFPGVFKTRAAFADWRSSVRGAIDAATGATARRAALAAQHDGWAVLRAALQPHVGCPRAPVHEKALISFDMLARMAREVGREPPKVDAASAKATHNALKAWIRSQGFPQGAQVRKLRATSTPNAPEIATQAAPPPLFMVRLSAST